MTTSTPGTPRPATTVPKAPLPETPLQAFIDGRWVSDNHSFEVTDPADGEVIAKVTDSNPDMAVSALDAAARAGHGWSRTPPRTRSQVLRRAFELLTQRTEDLARVMTAEMGKPLTESRGEVAYAAEFLRWFSEQAVRVHGDYGPNPEGTGVVITSRHPVGPCYLITPWNFPLAMATRKIAPALAAGCTVVLKPAEATPLTALLFTALLAEAGVPDGVVNVIPTTDAAGVSQALFDDPRLRKLSFTGSTAVGRSLLAQAAPGVLRTSMELGGNAPFVVFGDADLEAAVDGAMAAKFRNIGEACTAANRFFVHESLVGDFTDRILARVRDLKVGPGDVEGVQIGPLINRAAVDKVDELVRDAVDKGARLLLGGHPIEGPGTFYEPTVLDHIPADARLLREEIFGPVVAIGSFDSEPEAVERANDTEFGLVGYAFTRDLCRAQRLIDELEVGMLGLNMGVVSNAAAPFGGVKQSGLGREGGVEGIEEYLEVRYTLTPNPFD